ncbi:MULTISPECIES: hypothetical protein [Legionella]|uniref:Uncharacterized protein n=1 Tax=Legionella drozanskii LLAP-1 TaxID=1212489 RepID=A0A0W0TBR4_9GAMM|nr:MULTISPECIES: hypothetical protein [Legionella]KTC93014.1 hypothetical protein Ldro_0385 [Legionella drozanskii LLAP-1]PJE11919.1 MAG: hypothetical protein CK430_08095 [Legionella sp.]
MTKLVEIQTLLSVNYEKYFETKDLKYLRHNIESFRAVKNLKREVMSATKEDLSELNNSLFIVAICFVNYAFAVRDTENPEVVYGYVREAAECYELINEAIRDLPPSNLPQELSEQLTRSEFHSLKNEFQIALLNLYFMNINKVSPSEKSLNNIIQTLQGFKKQLEERYHKFDKQFKIKSLLAHIEKRLPNAQGLLTKLQQSNSSQTGNFDESPRQTSTLSSVRKRKPSQDEANNSDSSKKNSSDSRLRKGKDSAHLDSSKSTKKQVSKRVNIKKRRVVEENEEPSSSASLLQELAINAAKATRLPEPAVQAALPGQSISFGSEQEEISSFTIATPNLEEEETPILEMASTSDVAPAIVQTNSTVVSVLATSQGFFEPAPKPTHDLKEALQAWESAYFRDKEAGTSAKKSRALEKLAHALLLESIKLQGDSGDWSGLDRNPAIIIGVQLLVKSAEANPSYQYEAGFAQRLQKLSNRYTELLIPFLSVSFDELPSNKDLYLIDLVGEFMNIVKPNLNGLSVPQSTENVFKYLSNNLNERDYQNVYRGCLNTLIQATKVINQKMQHQSSNQELPSDVFKP